MTGISEIPIALEIGQSIVLVIDGVGAAGEGVGHADGRAVFVPGAAPGEQVRVEVAHLGNRKVTARLKQVLAPSEARVEPACPVYGRCGGCQLMHLSYPAQLDVKRRLLSDSLRSIAGIDTPFDGLPIAPAASPVAYRNRGQYPVALQAGRVVTGFYAPRSHRVVACERCLIQDPGVNSAVEQVRAWAGRKGLSIYDEARRSGWLRHVVVRVGQESTERLVVLVGTASRKADLADLARRLGQQAAGLSGLVVNVNPFNTNVVLSNMNHTFSGRDWIEEVLLGLRFRLSVGSFFQVHTAQAGVLFGKVRAFLGQPDGAVVDAYCGVGVLAQILAAAGHEVIGIEMFARAVADAEQNARDNGLGGARFLVGRVERVLPRLVKDGLKPAAVVLDPPRKGCEPEVLQAVADAGTRRVAYVSCHPGSLARDLKRLFELGYRLEHLEAVDMFPQTAHLETFAGLVQ